MSTPEARARFQRECEALARLNHPGIVRVHEAGFEGADPFVALELVEGRDLKAILEEGGPWAPDAAVALGVELCAAVSHAHAAGVLHRDLKPANVLIDREGRARITDFGLAKEVDARTVTATGAMLGTPAYMPPEQAAGEKARIGPACDVYGLAATLYEVLTGRAPFEGPMATILTHLFTRMPPAPSALRAGIPDALDEVLLRALAKEPADRHASAAELAAALQDALDGAAPAPRRGPRRAAWLLGVVALLGAAGGVALALARSSGAPVEGAAEAQAAEAQRRERAEHRWQELEAAHPTASDGKLVPKDGDLGRLRRHEAVRAWAAEHLSAAPARLANAVQRELERDAGRVLAVVRNATPAPGPPPSVVPVLVLVGLVRHFDLDRRAAHAAPRLAAEHEPPVVTASAGAASASLQVAPELRLVPLQELLQRVRVRVRFGEASLAAADQLLQLLLAFVHAVSLASPAPRPPRPPEPGEHGPGHGLALEVPAPGLQSGPMRRVLTVGHSYVVGVNRRLAHELARQGRGRWEVACGAPRRFRGTRDLRPQRLELGPDDAACRVVPLGAALTRRVHAFLYGPGLRKLLREGWDVVHAWEEPFVLAGGQIAGWTPRRAKLVFRTDQNLPKRYPPPFAWVERQAMQRADAWVHQGRLVGEALGARPGYAELPSRQIPYGVDTEVFRPEPARRAATLRRLGWEEGAPVVGYLGRFVREKGLELLTRALEGLRGAWRALLVGAGPLEPELRAWAARQGDRARVLADVTHDEAPAVLCAMDLLCAPSQTTPRWREQFGRMLIEAFASGVAVVGSDSGEIPHVIGEAGLVLGERDLPGWTAALEELVARPERRAELAARGLTRAREVYAWPVVARAHLDFFDALVEGRA
ncbi:MAG: protein kinase [Planctomycetota bacterium]